MFHIPFANLGTRTINLFVFVVFSLIFSVSAVSATDENSDEETRQEINEFQEDNSLNSLQNQVFLPITPAVNNSANSDSSQYCQIVVLNSGTLGASIEGNVLSSKLLNGRSGTAEITTTNSSYRLSVDTPFGFTSAPFGADSDTTMTTTFLGSGATNFSETPGNIEVQVERGSTLIETHLIAKRVNGTSFPPGHYSAELTVRCE